MIFVYSGEYNKSLICLSDAAITDPSLDVLVKMMVQLLDILEGLVQVRLFDCGYFI